MSETGVAALIAAVSFAVLTLTGIFVALRLNVLLRAATGMIQEADKRHETVLSRVNAAVDRTNAQLDRTEAVTAGMDKLGAGMNELSDQVNALAGFGRTMAGTVVGGPAGKAAAVAYGVRHAVGQRRRGNRRRTLAGEVVKGKETVAAGQSPRSVPDKKEARP
jgi:hypothetical protein